MTRTIKLFAGESFLFADGTRVQAVGAPETSRWPESIDLDWCATVERIQARGMSQAEIAAVCGCGQTTVSDLLNGKSVNPSFVLGVALMGLLNASDEEIARIAAPSSAAAAA